MELRQDVRVRIPDPSSPIGIHATEGVLIAAGPAVLELIAEDAGYKLVDVYDELGAWMLNDLQAVERLDQDQRLALRGHLETALNALDVLEALAAPEPEPDAADQEEAVSCS